jgi:ArsR family transcriptional regulator, arsenate/arsenite/antimonite-responsive transcriptional repressor
MKCRRGDRVRHAGEDDRDAENRPHPACVARLPRLTGHGGPAYLRWLLAQIDQPRYIDVVRYDRGGSIMTELGSEALACCGPLGAPVLSDEEAAATADVFKALADPARVRILNVLATSGEPVCVCHLVEPLGLSQPTVSHHLKRLTDAGLLEREQRGKWAYFSLRPEAVETLSAVVDLKGACC